MRHQLHLRFYGEVLPYLEVSKECEEQETILEVDAPKLTNKTLGEAKEILKEMGLEYEADTENQEEIIIDQLPKEGIKINQRTKILLYSK